MKKQLLFLPLIFSVTAFASDEIFKISLIDLNKGYSANELLMDSTISNRPVEVTRHINSIKESYGQINICLKEEDPYSLGCMSMKESQRSSALKLTSGIEITIRCEKMSGFAGMARGGDCEIRKAD